MGRRKLTYFAFLWLPTALAEQDEKWSPVAWWRNRKVRASPVQLSNVNRSVSEDRVSAAWTKIYQIRDGERGSNSFPLTTGAYGDITAAVGSSHAKLSDAEINSMATSRDGYSHVYYIQSSDCAQGLFIKTNDAYVDTAPSFGLTKANTLVGLGLSYESVSTWATLSSTEHGIDLLYTSPGLSGESCCRYFFGHGNVDCWGGSSGYRCVNGGNSCSSYKKLDDVVFYVYGSSTPATPAPTSTPTSAPTAYPTPYPTGFPTPFPTSSPTPSPTFPAGWPTPHPTFSSAGPMAGAAGGSAAATGDPHLQNIHGERFDLLQSGKHVLINIPRKERRASRVLLRVDAEAQRLGGQCADIYFQELNITGAWAEVKQTGGFSFHSRDVGEKYAHWLRFGNVQLKVAHGHTTRGVKYLNFYVKNLRRAGHDVGGLLGEDDHTQEEQSSKACVRRLAL